MFCLIGVHYLVYAYSILSADFLTISSWVDNQSEFTVWVYFKGMKLYGFVDIYHP